MGLMGNENCDCGGDMTPEYAAVSALHPTGSTLSRVPESAGRRRRLEEGDRVDTLARLAG
jgi:hypothetical protein